LKAALSPLEPRPRLRCRQRLPPRLALLLLLRSLLPPE
jgi:hypothetical protein